MPVARLISATLFIWSTTPSPGGRPRRRAGSEPFVALARKWVRFQYFHVRIIEPVVISSTKAVCLVVGFRMSFPLKMIMQ